MYSKANCIRRSAASSAAAHSSGRRTVARASQPVFIQRKCTDCDEELAQRKAALPFTPKQDASAGGDAVASDTASRIESSKGGGNPLPGTTRSFMESRFGNPFGDVRIHDNAEADHLSGDLGANAFTVGKDIFFAHGRYAPDSDAGQRLLAHELTHTVQQGEGGQIVQKDGDGTAPRGGFSINSPLIDEALVGISDIQAGIAGRALFASERELAESVFGASVDYSRVRIIIGDIAARTTAGNNIRLPRNFSIALNEEDKQLLVHEMTHVWQFQHNGAGYITTSLLQQLSAGATRGNRNFAYDYRINANNSFFEYAPEQQAFIVENYYAMLHDGPRLVAPDADTQTFRSNHLGPDGFNARISVADRRAEIATEMPNHQRLVGQMARTPFLNPQSLMMRRQENLMIMPPDMFGLPSAGGSGFTPTPSLLTLRFRGL